MAGPASKELDGITYQLFFKGATVISSNIS